MQKQRNHAEMNQLISFHLVSLLLSRLSPGQCGGGGGVLCVLLQGGGPRKWSNSFTRASSFESIHVSFATPGLHLRLVTQNGYARDQPLQKGESPLRICSLSKEEFQISKDAKFSPGLTKIKFPQN